MAARRPVHMLVAGCLALCSAGEPAAAEAPLSIIDWLETDDGAATRTDPPVTETAVQPEIQVQPLDAPVTPVGLVPPSVTGLPIDLWRTGDADQLTRRIAAAPVDGHPALRSLLYALLLAEALPPKDDAAAITLTRARIDKLLDLGALDPAKAMIEAADPLSHPALFARWADMAFLTGNENDICAALDGAPHLTPNRETLIFCVARRGDPNRATLLFDANRALGDLNPDIAPALDRFLHPELFEEAVPLPQPRTPTPLTYRLYEAIGERLPTASLPRRFAATDLRDVAGWKAQLEAAERLARTGAISSNTLLGIYTDRQPAASGGVWDRVSALQRFETALNTGSADAVAKTLPNAWVQMKNVGLSAPFADLFAEPLAAIDLPPSPSRTLALEMALLSSGYETLARNFSGQTDAERFWIALSQGTPDAAPAPTPLSQAVADGFAASSGLPPELSTERVGEAVLRAMVLFDQGANGNLGNLSDAIGILRTLGLEDVARRASLELLIAKEG